MQQSEHPIIALCTGACSKKNKTSNNLQRASIQLRGQLLRNSALDSSGIQVTLQRITVAVMIEMHVNCTHSRETTASSAAHYAFTLEFVSLKL